jgi:hypothetical protein
MQNTLTLAQMFDFNQVGRARIYDYRYGYSPHAPISALYELIMDASGKLVGRGYLSTSLIPHRVLQISISSNQTSTFLESVGSTELSYVPYEPHLEHTDDFPRIRIELWSHANMAPGAVPDLSLYTESQGEHHAPWGAATGGTSYSAPGAEIGSALLELAPALGQAERQKLLGDSEARLASFRSGTPDKRPPFSEAAARREHCWFSVDRVAGDEATTAWKRLARFRQARWRIAHELPPGHHPYAGGEEAKRVGSRIALEVARSTAANILSADALAAVHARLQSPEKHQMLSEDRLWADLLSSMPLCFNMFGSLVWNQAAAKHMVQQCWPDLPAGHVRVRFEHSPGRCDPEFLGNKTAFDVAFEIETTAGLIAIGVEVKYHEHAARAERPKPAALQRYIQVAERSKLFKPGWQAHVIETDLQQLWLDHLLVLSMCQHPSKRWSGGRFVLAYPSENPSFRAAAARYRDLLHDVSTFDEWTLEDMVRYLPNELLLRGRYL